MVTRALQAWGRGEHVPRGWEALACRAEDLGSPDGVPQVQVQRLLAMAQREVQMLTVTPPLPLRPQAWGHREREALAYRAEALGGPDGVPQVQVQPVEQAS